jgi:tetrapyrrole methylase family protein/MazG family protein
MNAIDLVVTRLEHPVVHWLEERARPLTFAKTLAASGDVDKSGAVAKLVVDRARIGGELVLAAPGSPLADDPTARAVLADARECGLSVDVVAAPSYLDGSTSAGLAANLVDGLQLAGSVPDVLEHPGNGQAPAGREDPFLGVYRELDLTRPIYFGPLYDARDVERTRCRLLDLFPADHMVLAVGFPNRGGSPTAVETTATDLKWRASDSAICVLTSPLERLEDRRSFDTLRYIVARLRAPSGCPWDREQTYASIKKHLIEETYEAVAALDDGDLVKFAEELGDVALQIVMYGQFGRELGDFTIDDVLQAVNEKLVRRHPHVFGDVAVADSNEVLRNWERIKRVEKSGAESTFSGIPKAAPALIRADAVLSRASRYGLIDRTDAQSILPPELVAADPLTRARFLGELLFDVVTVARRDHLDAEELLRVTTNRFSGAFERLLIRCRDEGISFDGLPPDERVRRLDAQLAIESTQDLR